MKRALFSLVSLMLLMTACGTVAEHNNAGNDALRAGDYVDAIEAYQAAQVAAPDEAESYYNAALAFYANNQTYDAIDALEIASHVAEDELAVKIYYNLGNAYMRVNDYRNAVRAYQAGLRLDPTDEDMRHNLEVALLLTVDATPTALEQQTEPDQQQSDPTVTPTFNPGGFDGPTPSPPPLDYDLSATPESNGGSGEDQSNTPVPQSEGNMTVEEAQRILDQVQQDQSTLQEFYLEEGGQGDTAEKDW